MPQSSRHSQCSLLNTSALFEGLPVMLCTKTCLRHNSLIATTHAQLFLEARHGFLVTDDDSPEEEFEKEDDLLAEADGLLAEDNKLFDEGDVLFTSDNGLFAEEEESVDVIAAFLDRVGVACFEEDVIEICCWTVVLYADDTDPVPVFLDSRSECTESFLIGIAEDCLCGDCALAGL
jgi:hypothetical protein